MKVKEKGKAEISKKSLKKDRDASKSPKKDVAVYRILKKFENEEDLYRVELVGGKRKRVSR